MVLICRTWACYDPETGASRSGHVCFTEPIECVRSYIERGGEKYLLLKAIGELFSERCAKKCKAFKSVIRSVIPQSILMCDYDDVSLLVSFMKFSCWRTFDKLLVVVLFPCHSDGLSALPDTDLDPNLGTDIRPKNGYCSDWRSES